MFLKDALTDLRTVLGTNFSTTIVVYLIKKTKTLPYAFAA